MNCFNRLASLLSVFIFTIVASRAQSTNVFNARSFGAMGDGATLDTKAIQTAIDKCSAAGGGTVLVTNGNFVVGTIYLKSDVSLRVATGATVLGSTNIEDYTTDTDRTMYNEP